MEKRITMLLLVLVVVVGRAQAQHAEPVGELLQDSVVMESTVYYQKSQCDWFYKAIGPFLSWAQTDTITPIVIMGWTGSSGTAAFNRELSLRRARTIKRYLVENGIAAHRITCEGRGIDTQAISEDIARRADMRGVIRKVVVPQPDEPAETIAADLVAEVAPIDTIKLLVEEIQPTVQPKAEVVQPKESEPKPVQEPTPATPVAPHPVAEVTPTDTIKLLVEEIQPTVQPKAQVVQPKESEPEPVQEPTPIITVAPQPQVAKEQSFCHPFAWYAGVELGMPLGVSTFTSFTPNGGVGFEGGIVGGYRFSPLLSLEAGISFGRMKLGASKCCEDYFLGADGVHYLEHVTGMTSYSYKDVYSSVSLQQYALRLNVDLLQICNPDWQKRWSLTVSPAIYGIGTSATLKTIESKTTIIGRNGQFQFGAGVGIGAGYQITDNLGIGLRTGMVWVFGERYDGIVPTDHKANIVWNNTVSLIWRFGKMKNEK